MSGILQLVEHGGGEPFAIQCREEETEEGVAVFEGVALDEDISLYLALALVVLAWGDVFGLVVEGKLLDSWPHLAYAL